MSDALQSLDLNALPAGVREAILATQEHAERQAEQIATLATQNAELEAANRRLEHLVKELNHLLYGPKSERLSEDKRQMAFEDLEIAVAEAQAQSDAVE